MHQQSPYDDPRSTVSRVERHDDQHRPVLNRGRSNTFSAYRPYEDALYYNQPKQQQPRQIIPQRRRHSMQRRTHRWDDSDSDFSDSSDDEDYRGHRSHSRPRGRTIARRPHARDRSPSSDSSRPRSHSLHHRRSHSRPTHRQIQQQQPRPNETYTLTKALKSAAMAATVEAVRCRAEPGSWKGQKSQRVAVAACSGAAVGSLRNGRLQKSGKLPYAEAAMTGAYSVDFLKRVLRQTEYAKDAEKERKEREVENDVREERKRYGRDRSRSRRR